MTVFVGIELEQMFETNVPDCFSASAVLVAGLVVGDTPLPLP
jgi:hypothetical protein